MSYSLSRGTKGYRINGACVDIEFMVLGMIQNNVYIISDGTTTFVVDPAASADRIVDALGGRTLDAIVVTHRHADHIGALKDLKDKTGAPVYASAIDAPEIEHPSGSDGPLRVQGCPVDVTVGDKDTITLGAMRWKILLTPGHTEGGICLFLDAADTNHPEADNVLISGDTLFCGSIGRTDFPGGNDKQMRTSLRRLSQLPDDTVVLPGHNSPTSIGEEQRRVFAYFC